MAELRTENLILRPPAKRDLQPMTDMLDDIAVSRMLARVPHPYRLEDARAWFAMVERGDQDEPAFTINLDGSIAGMIGFKNEPDERSLGFWLGRQFWGRGLMSEAAQAAIAWFFSRYDCDALHAGAFEDNPASLRVQEKLGFEVIGSAPLHCVATGRPRREIKTRLRRETFAHPVL
jgi:RimJ/RimL family protein N-acetyltransferase